MTEIHQLIARTELKQVFFRSLGALFLTALISSCATTKPSGTDIKARAQARWDALLAGDFDTAYGFYSPGYRSSTSRVDFEIEIRSHRIRWISAEVLEPSCEADVCTMETRIGYSVAGAVPGVPEWKSVKHLNERWVRTDGQWWFLSDK